MPLSKGKSQKSFEKNLKTEMEHGKPKKQSLAIAYSMQRKAKKKMADGGQVSQPANPNSPSSMGVPGGVLSAMNINKKAEGGMASSCPQCGYAHGGMIEDNYQPSGKPNVSGPAIHEQSNWLPERGRNDVRPNASAMAQTNRKLGQHGEIERGPNGAYASGGFITDNEQSDAHMLDMVGRIIAQRQQSFSKGGKVANDDHPFEADFEDPNQFDDLVLRDDLESSYDADDNSGDQIGDAQENEDRKDIVSRIMKSRKKKDRNPVPA